MKRCVLIAVVLAGFMGLIQADEIDFIEDFALAKDRNAALRQLIPGTEDYYYYRCLHLQNEKRFDELDKVLGEWIKRYLDTPLIREIRNRQALLTYELDPAQSLKYLRGRLDLRFDHQREALGSEPTLATRLDPALIDRQALKERAFKEHQNLAGFEDRALDWLVTSELNSQRRRHLLERLKRPDHPGLARLVVADLKHRTSRGFGSLDIHGHLLLTQLDECLVLASDLLENRKFVETYLRKLRPGNDTNWAQNRSAERDYLERLERFTSRLSPSFNSLKAHVLYHRLALDLAAGHIDKARFLAYLALPRRAGYMDRKYVLRDVNRRYAANLSADFESVTALPSIRNDESLVRRYLEHFFQTEDSYSAFQPFVSETYLEHFFAETKILAGAGDPERWASMLPPAKFQQIKDRVDLIFDPQNRALFAGDDPVELDLHVKNVSKLIIRIFEINTWNYYRKHQREVDSDIELDGLVPGEEIVLTYDESPLRRVRRSFEFPSLRQPGVYVIDFIGNGQNSRALIRKGELDFLVRTSIAGHIFSVLDEQGKLVKDATLWLDGHQYHPVEDGHIAVPFTNKPKTQPIVLQRGGLAALKSFEHVSEEFRFAAGIHVDRQSLIAGEKAQVVVRPQLRLQEIPVTLSLLEDVRLVLSSEDHDGITSSTTIHNFALHENRESIYTFQVPPRLAKLSVAIEAKVPILSQGKKVDLSAQRTFTLNAIDRTAKIEDLFLRCVRGGYVLKLLGKNGEPLTGRPVKLTLKHREFTEPVNLTLQTDDRGRTALGRLDDIAWIRTTDASGTSHTWNLLRDRNNHYDSRHGLAGEPLEISVAAIGESTSRRALSLLELRGDTFATDRFDALAVSPGVVAVSGLPAGDYDLLLKDTGERIRIRLTAGHRCESYLVGASRRLEERGSKPLQITAIEVGDEKLRIHLHNFSRFARIHVFAGTYHPEYFPYSNLRVRDVEPYQFVTRRGESRYLEGRDIGDEYRYIIDRKYLKKYPGNMLARPSLLLNPWEVRSTETGQQPPAVGDAIGVGGGAGGRFGGRYRKRSAGGIGADKFSSFDFLAEAATVRLNLVPDERGVVVVPRQDLGAHQDVHIVAVDPVSTAYRRVQLPDQNTPHRELRLTAGLDPAHHFSQQKKVIIVQKGQKLVLEDVGTASLEAYDSLTKVYEYYVTSTGDTKLIEFGFILGWPQLDEAAKRAQYSRYACHELNFFIYERDPAFFEAVVRPYLHNKKDKTFLDAWLIEADLRGYLRPWQYAQLNVVERILLAQRIPAERGATAREISDLFDLLIPDAERQNALFQMALLCSALDEGDRFGLGAAKEEIATAANERFREMLKRVDRPPAEDAAAVGADIEEELEEMESMAEFARPVSKGKSAGKKRKAPPAAARAGKRRSRAPADEEEVAKLKEGHAAADDLEILESDFYAREEAIYGEALQFYRSAEPTKEWAENNYYKLPIAQQNADLITTNALWRDYARHDRSQPFFSPHFIESNRNFTEMMFVLAMLDLPFSSSDHEAEFAQRSMTLTAATPMLAVHEEIVPVASADGESSILVSQKYFPHGDRHRYVGREKVDNYITDEFLVNRVYGTQLVITNLASTKRKLDILLQIPEGAIAVLGGRATRSVPVDLDPYRTAAIEYHFYFPGAGQFAHYPVQVTADDRVIAHAEPLTFNVVDKLQQADPQSWPYISQWGSAEEVFDYLNRNNLYRTDLNRIAFRMRQPDFFRRTIDLLGKRHVYNHTLWSYGLFHDVPAAIRDYLALAKDFVAACGASIDSELLAIDPVVRKTYEHLDYKPLINARAHLLGRQRQILNDRFHTQYHRLLKILSYRSALNDADRMAVVYYLLLQDRIEEALDFFASVDLARLTTRLQYDYFNAYLDFYTPGQDLARRISERYKDYPVAKWRSAFAAIAGQLAAIDGAAPGLTDPESREQRQAQLAHAAPTFDFSVEAKTIAVDHQNLEQLRIDYYLMDLELLFSRKPFVQQFAGQFSHIRPNATALVDLREGEGHTDIALPITFHNANVLIEITGAGRTLSRAYYSNALDVQLIENYGQLRVSHDGSGKPLSTVYVKVYARMASGAVKFYKDGYTDLRGRFDYASLSTTDLNQVARFSILVISDEYGAIVREAAPPKQ